MTATATANQPAPATDTWTAQLDHLRDRYKHLRPAVLAAVNVLLHDENINDDDAKARAAAHGVRITAASLNAARTVLSRMDSKAPAAKPNKAKAPTTAIQARPARRPRATKEIDAQALIKQVVDRIQDAGSAETQRLRDGIQKAIGALQAVLSS